MQTAVEEQTSPDERDGEPSDNLKSQPVIGMLGRNHSAPHVRLDDVIGAFQRQIDPRALALAIRQGVLGALTNDRSILK